MSSPLETRSVLFLALSGIGNFIMQLPTIEALKKARPHWRVTVWVAPRNTKPLAQARPSIDEIVEAKLQRSIFGHVRLVWRLAQRKPDTAIMLSPGQRMKGAAYMFLTGANQRLAHRYQYRRNPTSHFLLTDSLVEEEGYHDVDQNLKLLELLGIAVADRLGQPYSFSPSAESTRHAQTLLRALRIPSDRKIIGVHAGSEPHFLWKRWPLDRFAQVAKTLVANYHAHILIFGGPEERKQKKTLQRMIGKAHASSIATDLLTVAGLMTHCRLFVANDSGLMHLAAAVGVATFGLFGPTDEAATGPRGPKSYVIRAFETAPVYHTERSFNLGLKPHESLLKITPQMVLHAVAQALD